MYREMPIKTYKGTGWDRFTTTEFYGISEKETHNMLFVEDRTPGKEERLEIQFRRVDRESSAIQFEIKKVKNNRTSYFSFAVPECMAEDFINAITKPHGKESKISPERKLGNQKSLD